MQQVIQKTEKAIASISSNLLWHPCTAQRCRKKIMKLKWEAYIFRGMTYW